LNCGFALWGMASDPIHARKQILNTGAPCPSCQTGGRRLNDRRLDRLIR
jgi:hypothetical protein